MWQTVGQTRIIDWLRRALKQGTLGHAYLLVGPRQIGKMSLALDLAMALNCQSDTEEKPCGACPACQKIKAGNHADVQIINLTQYLDAESPKERTEIGIDQIKNVLHTASLPPFEGKCRVYVIDEAGNLSSDAANCLLKTLEEPGSNVLFILLTTNARLIPATVVSRCQRLNLTRVKTAEIESTLISRWNLEPDQAKLLAGLSHGCPGWARQAVDNPEPLRVRSERFENLRSLMQSGYSERFSVAYQLAMQFSRKREAVYEILDAWLGWWRDVLLVKTGCHADIVNSDYLPALSEMAGIYDLAQIATAISNLREASEQLKLNANSRLVLEALMLDLPAAQASRMKV
jgi:DNA polymerase III subunit delta'